MDGAAVHRYERSLMFTQCATSDVVRLALTYQPVVSSVLAHTDEHRVRVIINVPGITPDHAIISYTGIIRTHLLLL